MEKKEKKSDKLDFLDKLKLHLDARNVSLKEAATHVEVSERRLRANFRDDVKKKTGDDAHPPEWLLYRLYFSYDIPLKEFGINKNKYITEHSPDESHLSELFIKKVNTATGQSAEEFINEYHQKLAPYIRGVEDRIWIYDYLASNSQNVQYYHQAHTQYYKLIEARLRNNPNIQYQRIVALPIEWSISNSKDKGSGLAEFISFCSLQAFTHYMKCLKEFPNQFKLIVTFAPTRLYSYGLLDDTHVISELFRYNQRSVIHPGMFFINHATKRNKISKLLNIYEGEMKEFLLSEKESLINLNKGLILLGISNKMGLLNDRLQKLKDDQEERLSRLQTMHPSYNRPNTQELNFFKLDDDVKKMKNMIKDLEKKKKSYDGFFGKKSS